MASKPFVLVTGASTGIGAAYAEPFARRGHDLVLVACNTARMEALADRLRSDTGVTIDIVPADLANPAERVAVEARLRDDARVGTVINNAGASLAGTFIEQAIDDIDRRSTRLRLC